MEKNNHHSHSSSHEKIVSKLMELSAQEFRDFGANGLGYIKPLGIVGDSEEPMFSLHAANGSHIATGDNVDILFGIASQHNIVPIWVQ